MNKPQTETIETSLPDPSFFKALSEPNRLAMLSWLCACNQPRSVSEVAGCCDVDQSVVSRHLAQLREAGILIAERQGRQVRYAVDAVKVVSALRGLADTIENCCCVQQRETRTQGEHHE